MDIITNVWNTIKNALPLSPVQQLVGDQEILPIWLRYFKWFFPVAECIALMELWLTCILAYYIISAILRNFKIIS